MTNAWLGVVSSKTIPKLIIIASAGFDQSILNKHCDLIAISIHFIYVVLDIWLLFRRFYRFAFSIQTNWLAQEKIYTVNGKNQFIHIRFRFGKKLPMNFHNSDKIFFVGSLVCVSVWVCECAYAYMWAIVRVDLSGIAMIPLCQNSIVFCTIHIFHLQQLRIIY